MKRTMYDPPMPAVPAKRCPWVARACDCQEFPWKVDGYIPSKCIWPDGVFGGVADSWVVRKYAKDIVHYYDYAKRGG